MPNFVVVGLGLGDEGKGTVVNRLCEAHDVGLVVRYNGGCQAAHSVVLDDGRQHTFAQFGSGTLQGVPTFLSKFMLFEPLSAVVEGQALERIGIADPFDLLFVSPDALMTTPYHWLLNRWREDRRAEHGGQHGSCGRGVGATAEFALLHPDEAPHVRDLTNSVAALDRLEAVRDWVSAESNGDLVLPDPREVWLRYAEVRSLIRISPDEVLRADGLKKSIVFEGAQGILLDEDWGFHPYTTWSHTTTRNARQLIDEYDLGHAEEVGVVRAYSTRHGAGPFVTEDSSLDLPETHNKAEHFQGRWRVGHFDGPAIRYAVKANGGVDSVYVTHVDAANNEPRLQLCYSYVRIGASLHTREHQDIHMIDVDDFDARAYQSQLTLRASHPVLRDRQGPWDQTISEFLDLPLAGVGYGPRTSDGDFRPVSLVYK